MRSVMPPGELCRIIRDYVAFAIYLSPPLFIYEGFIAFAPLSLASRRDRSVTPNRHPIRGHCGGKGIRTLDTLLRYTHFPGVLLRPLGHSSKNLSKNNPPLRHPVFHSFCPACGELPANSRKQVLRVKVRINIYCAQHPCEFRRFYNPVACTCHSVISPRIGVCR